jgi:4-carboxymuconolactone decarboxylase
VPLARKAGVREEAIAAVRDRKASGELTEIERLVVGYVSQLLGTRRVDEPIFHAAEARFGIQGTVDLTTLAGYYAMIACNLNAFGITPEAAAERLPV